MTALRLKVWVAPSVCVHRSTTLGSQSSCGAVVAQLVEAGTDQEAQFCRNFGLGRKVAFDATRRGVQQVHGGHGAAMADARHRLREDGRDEDLDLLGACQCGSGAFRLPLCAVALPERDQCADAEGERDRDLGVGTSHHGQKQTQCDGRFGFVATEPALGDVPSCRGTRVDRFTAQMPLQVVGQRVSGRVSLAGELRKRLDEDSVQVAGQLVYAVRSVVVVLARGTSTRATASANAAGPKPAGSR